MLIANIKRLTYGVVWGDERIREILPSAFRPFASFGSIDGHLGRSAWWSRAGTAHQVQRAMPFQPRAAPTGNSPSTALKASCRAVPARLAQRAYASPWPRRRSIRAPRKRCRHIREQAGGHAAMAYVRRLGPCRLHPRAEVASRKDEEESVVSRKEEGEFANRKWKSRPLFECVTA
jgi:hypothetical protein